MRAVLDQGRHITPHYIYFLLFIRPMLRQLRGAALAGETRPPYVPVMNANCPAGRGRGRVLCYYGFMERNTSYPSALNENADPISFSSVEKRSGTPKRSAFSSSVQRRDSSFVPFLIHTEHGAPAGVSAVPGGETASRVTTVRGAALERRQDAIPPH